MACCYDCSGTIDIELSRPARVEGCFPVERWTDIVQALSDFSGYTVVLRAHVFEPVPGGVQVVGHKDVLTTSPEIFFVTDKCDCCKHITTEDNGQKK